MSWFSHTGNSAEDKMSDAAGCIAFAVIAVIAIAGVAIGLFVRWLIA